MEDATEEEEVPPPHNFCSRNFTLHIKKKNQRSRREIDFSFQIHINIVGVA